VTHRPLKPETRNLKPSVDHGRWARPPRPFRTDADRWRSYVRTIGKRIAAIRKREGIDSSVRPWQTFSPPLPPLVDLDPPPAVRLRLAPIPRLERDPNGRLLARRDTPEESAS
jgi:hypothetical protein